MSVRTPSRTTSWSSTIKILAGIPKSPLSFTAGAKRSAFELTSVYRRDGCTYQRPGFLVNDFELSLQLPQALVHPSDPDTQGSHPVFSGLLQNSAIKALALIFNFEDGVSTVVEESHLGAFASRMPMNIRQAFLQDTEHGYFRFG